MNIATIATIAAVASGLACAAFFLSVVITALRRERKVKPIPTELLPLRMGKDFLNAPVAVRNAAHHLIILDEALSETISFSAGEWEATLMIYRGFVRKALHELKNSK